MLRKLFAFFLLTTSSCAVIYSQKTPETPQEPAKTPKPMVWSFQMEGSYLGIEPQEVTTENYGKLGLSEVRGVMIEKVLENSPAAKAGLQAGDVILKFDGEEVTSIRKLTRLISEVAPDHQASILISRGGSEREVAVTIGKQELPKFENGNFKMEMPVMPKLTPMTPMPPMPPMPNVQVTPMMKPNENVFVWSGGRQIGVSTMPLTKQLGEYFGVAEGKGLLINSVRENSPAAKAGLQAGDVIIEAEGKEIKNNLDLMRTINEKKEGDVTLTIIRDKVRQTISVTPEEGKGGMNSFGFEFETPVISQEAIPSMNLKTPMPQMQVVPFTAPVPQTIVAPKRVL